MLETSTGGYGLSTGKTSALLVYLAYRGERVRREAVMALLWPESTEERARGNLRQLLHIVRRLDFTDTLKVTESWLSWPVPTDVADFCRALQAGDARTALALYGGAFLEDFEERRSSAFGDWLETEREALYSAYRRAVFGHAGELRRDPAAAADSFTRLLQHDPSTRTPSRLGSSFSPRRGRRGRPSPSTRVTGSVWSANSARPLPEP